MKKLILPIIFTILFTLVLIFVFSLDMRSELSSQISSALSFTIQIEGVQEEISAWSEDGEYYYVFFPSHAGLNDATFHLHTTTKMFLNSQLLTDDFDLSGLEFETPYELRYSFYGTTQTAELMFLQSANVATMYIHTETGSMNKIHLDKDYKENAEIILMDVEGNVSYAGIGNDKIKGRGNATWHYDKKPYILQLHEARDLLGMDASEKWILLPNSSDVSNIRNKLVYDFAEKTDLYWTPDCEYVDLYLNGEYAGLYLLTEKIEISESRLDLSENTYLFALETGVLGNDFGDNFFTEANQRIEISNPVDLTDQEIDDFRAYIQSAENSILSGSSDLFEYIDLDSWVKKYLIEEIFINVDARINSQYFYRDERLSAKMFAGPIWDYDYSLGNHHHLAIQNPACFYASEVQKTPDWSTPWYAALYHNDVFYQRLVEIYQNEYLLLLNDLVNHDIIALSEEIEQAAANNNIRWAGLFAGHRTYQEEVQYIQDFLEKRINFLNRAWIDEISYYTIQIDTVTQRYLYFDVEPGKTVDLLPSPRELGLSDSMVWYINGTNAAFDATEPVESDLLLCVPPASETRSFISAVLTKIKSDPVNFMFLVSAGAIMILMLVLLIVDWRRNQRKKVETYEQHQ